MVPFATPVRSRSNKSMIDQINITAINHKTETADQEESATISWKRGIFTKGLIYK